jgi:hypothetical protein
MYGVRVLVGLIVPLLLTPDAERGPEDRLADLAEWATESGHLELASCVAARQADAEASMAFYEAYLAELPDLRGVERAEVEIRMDLAVLDARAREVEAWDVCLGGMGERALWATRDAGRKARSAGPDCADAALVLELEDAAAQAFESMTEHWGSDLARIELSRLVMAQNRLVGVAETALRCHDPAYAGSIDIETNEPVFDGDDTIGERP